MSLTTRYGQQGDQSQSEAKLLQRHLSETDECRVHSGAYRPRSVFEHHWVVLQLSVCALYSFTRRRYSPREIRTQR